jgi:hypothetical protein
MARIRSPNYPAISLAEAIKRIGQVHTKERQHLASRDVILKGMGYGGVNGVSLGVLSAVLKYGLLEQQGRGEDYRVTDRAVRILHPHDPAEKVAAINEAATAPPLFAELLDHFKGDLPSDDNLRAYLVRRGFSQTSLPNVIQAFRDTLEIASLEDLSHNAPLAVTKERPVALRETSSAHTPQQAFSPEEVKTFVASQLNRATLTLEEGTAVLEIPASISKRSHNALKLWLELMLKLAEADSPSIPSS